MSVKTVLLIVCTHHFLGIVLSSSDYLTVKMPNSKFRNYSIRNLESAKPHFRVKRSSFQCHPKMSWLCFIRRKSNTTGKLFPNLMAASLRLVGLYLAAHKYFEVDRRYTFSTTRYEDRKFFKHFPIPRLKRLHPDVEQACNKGEFECITEIATVANMSGSLAKFHKNYTKGLIPTEYPFTSALEQFQYRTTASYYMCWYTDRRSKFLAYDAKKGCLADLWKVEEAVYKIHDHRSKFIDTVAKNEPHFISPYTCAYLWFCPDPCYGKSTSGNVISEKKAKADPLNPCSQLKDKTCSWETGKNTNFDYLVRNRINYTCNCEKERKGFIWSPKYSICIDQDECYDDLAKCPSDKICRNTVGAYKCQCRRGFRLNMTTTRCDRHALFRPTSQVGMKKRLDKQQEDQTGIWANIDRLFGLNSSSKMHCSMLLHAIILLLCIVLQ